MARRTRYRRNPGQSSSKMLWGALAAVAAVSYLQKHNRNQRLAKAQPAYTTPTVTPGPQVPPTPPVEMVARWTQAQAPGYAGVPYGSPVWNGQNWEQPE
jgi:hypothetical protein